MKKRFLIMTLVLLFLINITALATLSYNRWFKTRPIQTGAEISDSWEAFKEQISLNPRQAKTMQNFRLSFEEEVESLRQQMEEKRNSLIEEARNVSPDLNRIDRIIEELSGLQADIQKKSMRNLLKDKELLSPGQQERYFSLLDRHAHGRGWSQGRKGVRGRGPRWLRDNQKDTKTNLR
jgi:Spy/CpxP family protein refolding chaperone